MTWSDDWILDIISPPSRTPVSGGCSTGTNFIRISTDISIIRTVCGTIRGAARGGVIASMLSILFRLEGFRKLFDVMKGLSWKERVFQFNDVSILESYARKFCIVFCEPFVR